MRRVDLNDLEIRQEFALKFISGFCPPDEAFIDETDMSLKIRFDTGAGKESRLEITYPQHCWRWRPSMVN